MDSVTMIARSITPVVGENVCSSPSGCQLSVVIPVYRSEATLESLLSQLVGTLDSIGRTYEIILVEDGSGDGTWAKLESLVPCYPGKLIAIQLMRNFGQHNAMMCGFRHARGELIITMDDDLQNPPSEISKLIEKIEQSDCDLVYGRYAEKQHESFRNLGSKIVNSYFRYVFSASVSVTSFRIIRRSLLQSVVSNDRPDLFLDGLLAWNTRRIASVLVEHHPRAVGRSTYCLKKLGTLAMSLFASFSLLPLNLIAVAGLMVGLIGLGYGTILVGRTPFTMQGISLGESILAIGMLLGGIQLFSTGIVGQYVGRLLLSANGKPQYRERVVLGTNGSLDQAGGYHCSLRKVA